MRASKLHALDSARGVAALAVVVHHAACAFAPDLVHDRYAPWLRIAFQGAFPVRFFFVLSGFVLSLSYFRSGRVAALRSAAVRRAFRLGVPVAAAVAFAYALFALGLYFNVPAGVAQHQPPDRRWLLHWYLFTPSAADAAAEVCWRTFFHHDTYRTYNNVLWTMGAEFRGSLFVFALLALVGGLRNRAVLYFAVGVVLWRLGLFHLIDFVAGAALCDWYVARGAAAGAADRNGFAMAALLITAGLVIGGSAPADVETAKYYGVAVVPPRLWMTAAAVMVVAGVVYSPAVQSALVARPLALLGRMSFSLYLIHVPVFCSLSSWLYLWLTWDGTWGHGPSAAVAAAAGTAVSLFLGWVGSVMVEPFSIWLGKKVETDVFQPPPDADPNGCPGPAAA